MKRLAIIKSNKGEIFPEEAIGSTVQLIGKERISDWDNQKYYRVKYLDERFKKYNGLCLAGGGRFDDIYTNNLKILEGEKNNGLK